MITNSRLYEIIYPYISSCSGFIKTNGHFAIFNKKIIMMSKDGAFIVEIYINHPEITEDFTFISNINKFTKLKVKDGQDYNILDNSTYTTGDNIIYYNIIEKSTLINSHINNNNLEYIEDDIYNIPTFVENINSKNFSWTNMININNTNYMYKLYTHKCIFILNKGETCSVNIYSDIYGDNSFKIVEYQIYKKKIKSLIKIYTRQFVYSR